MWDDFNPLASLLTEHLTRRPTMQPRDIYKLLYQAVRGLEHLVSSPQSFRASLESEWLSLAPGETDPLLESIRPDGSLFRINLRPFKAASGDLEELAAACLETAARPWGTQAELQQVWKDFVHHCNADRCFGLDQHEVDTLTTWLQENDYPPLHHSDSYRTLYHPAYRLVAADSSLANVLRSAGTQLLP